jgi:hypothetical protein
VDGRGNSASHQLTGGPTRAGGTRLLEYALVVAIFLGSLALWIAVPFGSLWLASRVSGDGETVILTALVACPVLMLACGVLLGRLYTAYLRVSGARPGADRSAWLGSLSGERRTKRGRRPILDASLTFSAGTAIVLLLVWFFFLAENYSPAGFVP